MRRGASTPSLKTGGVNPLAHDDDDETTEELDRSSVKTSARNQTAETPEPLSPYRSETIPRSNVSLVHSTRRGASEEKDGGVDSSTATYTGDVEQGYPPKANGVDAIGVHDGRAKEIGYPEGGWRAWGNVFGAWVCSSPKRT